MTGFFWFVGLVLIPAVLAFYIFYYRRWQRQRIASRPFPDEWDALLHDNMVLYRHLPAHYQKRLQQLTLIFLHEKRFYGCGDLTLTDPMKVLIAAHACLLVLERGLTHYDSLRSILVYPGAYQAQLQSMENGVHTTSDVARLGESWHQGKVILSWQNVLSDSQQLHHGSNVALHEFSHQLDQVNGAADGFPELSAGQSVKDWTRVFEKEFSDLREQVSRHHRASINAYGAENPAEFFAVVSEAFFTEPAKLQRQHPELFEQLRSYYKLNPLQWFES